LYVPPGTNDDEQQFAFPLGPHVEARPLQLGRTVQAPLLQVGVAAVHAVVVPHCPLASHFWTPFPEHRAAAGAQTPAQAPLMHV
jgi:hypothetical protein